MKRARPRPETGRTERPAAPRELSPGERAVVRELARQVVAASPQKVRGPAAETGAGRLEGQFVLYLEAILGWTRDSNLVARGDLGRLASRHLAESVAVLPILDRLGAQRVIDLGSGAGFPAIPVQLARPDLHVTLVESRRRKGLFLGRVVQILGLTNAQVLIERAEHLRPDGDAGVGQFDVATARAVAPVAELLGWLAPLVRPGGHAVLFKGSSYAEELRAWAASATATMPKGVAPAWKEIEVVPVADRHLYFAVLERLP